MNVQFCVCVCVCFCSRFTGQRDGPADVLFGGIEKGGITEEVSKWCHMYSMWEPPPLLPLPLVFFLTFLCGAQYLFTRTWEDSRFSVFCGLGRWCSSSFLSHSSFAFTPSLHPRSTTKPSSSSTSCPESTMTLTLLLLQRDDAFSCSHSAVHHHPPAALHASHTREPQGGAHCVFALWVCFKSLYPVQISSSPVENR